MKLQEWMEREVYPVLFDGLPQFFFDFGWKAGNGCWTATNASVTRNLPGSPKPKQVVAYADRPHGFFVHGGAELGFVRWVSYVAGRPGSQLSYEEWREGAKELAALAGRPYSGSDSDGGDEQTEWRELCLEAFLDVCRQALYLPQADRALHYLEQRGLSRDEAEHLDFGFFTTTEEVRERLTNVKGVPAEVIERSGLLRDGRWTGRLVAPWRDRRGRVGTIWARDLSGDVKGHEKYLYLSTGEKGFGKRKAELVAFGLDKALRSPKSNDLIVVEGLMDAITPYSMGLTNVIAIGGGGSELSTARLETLNRLGVDRLTLILDNDPSENGRWPGREGTVAILRNANKAESPVPSIFVIDPAELGQAKDLDELLRQTGKEVLDDLLERRMHAFRFQARVIVEEHKPKGDWTDSARDSVLQAAKAFAASCPQERAPELDIHFWSEIEEATGASRQSLSDALSAMREKRERKEQLRTFDSLHRSVGQALQANDLDTVRTLLEDEAPRLLAVERKRTVDPILSISDELEEHERYLSSMRGRPFIGVTQKTIAELDEATMGLRGLMLLAAAPNVGKTTLAVQLGTDVVRHSEDTCFLFLSLEMRRMEILSRIKSRLAQTGWKRLVMGDDKQQKLFEKRLSEVNADMARWGERMLILDERNFPEPTVEKVISQLERLKAATGARKGIILVDYLQVWPVPASEARYIRSDLDADKWRIGQMKSLRDATDDDAIMVISEARKPSGADRGSWASNMSDIMGSARGSYTPDMIFLFVPFTDSALSKAYHIPTDDVDALEELKIRMNGIGVAHNTLKIVKGRDGVERRSMDLTYWYRQSRFESGVQTDWDH